MPPPNPAPGQQAISLTDDDVTSAEDRMAADLEEQIRNYNPAAFMENFNRMIKLEEIKSEDEGTQDNAAFQDWNIEAEGEEEFRNAIGLTIDLTGDDDDDAAQQFNRGRSSPVRFTVEPEVQTITEGGINAPHLEEEIKVGSFYELNMAVEKYIKITFIRITSFKKYPGAPWLAVGIPHARTRTLLGQLPRKTNEVFALYEVTDGNPNTIQQQAEVEIPVSSIARRRFFHITNAAYPAFRFDPSLYATTKDVEDNGPFICRWNLIVHYHSHINRVIHKPYEWELRRITASEVEKVRFRVDEEALRHEWRGPTVRGGTHNARGVELGPDVAQPKERAVGQKYTFFDAFCGAGGASRGAERAGYEVKYGVDMWDRAAASWRMNFPRAEMFEMDIADFMMRTAGVTIRVDCLHLSPPCQVWSPAHTIPGQHDERNIMALFACRTLVDKVRPRVITLEQTFGILNPVFKKYFDALVLGFTEQGYSIGWKIINCAAYGLPQRRTRLVMVAACPGEELPGFPEPTHSSTGGNGLQKYTSILQAISKVSGETAANDPHHCPKYKLAPRDAVIGDPNQILPRCMTTSGGQNYHYSGIRCYTNREFACLQGFPIWHKFSESYVKKQIGNAFPPVVVQALYEHIQKYLHKRDGFEGDSRPRVIAGVAVDVEDLEDGGGQQPVVGAGATMDNAIEIGDNDDVEMIDRPASRASEASSRTLSGDELFVVG
jgi:DNA (cytosine-5)-methyltransferase 1